MPTICSLCISSQNAIWWIDNEGKSLKYAHDAMSSCANITLPKYANNCVTHFILANAHVDPGSILPCFHLPTWSIFGLCCLTVLYMQVIPMGWLPCSIWYSLTHTSSVYLSLFGIHQWLAEFEGGFLVLLLSFFPPAFLLPSYSNPCSLSLICLPNIENQFAAPWMKVVEVLLNDWSYSSGCGLFKIWTWLFWMNRCMSLPERMSLQLESCHCCSLLFRQLL